MEELIEKLKEIGFEVVAEDDDCIWVLRKKASDGVAQVCVLKSEA